MKGVEKILGQRLEKACRNTHSAVDADRARPVGRLRQRSNLGDGHVASAELPKTSPEDELLLATTLFPRTPRIRWNDLARPRVVISERHQEIGP